MNNHPLAFIAYIAVSSFCLGLLLIFGAVFPAGGCRATVPVVVSQNNFNCESRVENHDGTITFTGCKADGQQPVETGGSPGDENINVKPEPGSALDSLPAWRLAALRN